MLTINLELTNPQSTRFKNLWYRFGSVGKNKGWEFNGYLDNTLFKFMIEIRHKQDHPGLYTELALFGFKIEFIFHDSRHWNHKANRFYLPGEEADEWLDAFAE